MFVIRRWHLLSLLTVGASVLIMTMYMATSAAQSGDVLPTAPFMEALPLSLFLDAVFIFLIGWVSFVFTAEQLKGYQNLGYFLSIVLATVGAYFFILLVPMEVLGIRTILTFGITPSGGGLDVNIGAALQALMLAFFWWATLSMPNAVLMARAISQGRSGKLMRPVFKATELGDEDLGD